VSHQAKIPIRQENWLSKILQKFKTHNKICQIYLDNQIMSGKDNFLVG
jgi:hypothetical protein